MKKKLWLWIVIIVVIGGLAWWFGGGSNVVLNKPSLPPVAVKAMAIKAQDKPLTLDFIGQVQAYHEVEIRPQVSGFIVEKLIDGGQRIQKGQLMYRIDAQPYKINLLTAQAELISSQASLDNSIQNNARSKMLYEANAISEQEYNNSYTMLERIKGSVEVAESRVGLARIDLGFTEISAPIDGNLSTAMLEVGSYVSKGQTVLAKISANNPVLVSFSLSEGEYLSFFDSYKKRANPEQLKVRLIMEDGSVYPYIGAVTQMESGLTVGTGSINFKAEFSNPNGLLLPGLFAKIRAVVEVRKNAILVPQRAITDLMGKKMVTVVLPDNTTEQRVVKVGAQVDNLALIDSGVKAGETIIVEGSNKVAPGQTVKAEIVTLEASEPQAGR